MAALALAVGGCASLGGFGSFFGTKKPEVRAYASDDVTGSAGQARPASATALAAAPSETDLVFAKLAIVDVLGRGNKDISAPWENPGSGARGTVTPIASAYKKEGATCHDFLASYIRQGKESWLQGEACRVRKGNWEVKSLGPWKRT